MPEFVTDDVHQDPYPSRIAMEAAVELEIHSAIGRIQTQTVGKVIQRAVDKAVEHHRTALRNAKEYVEAQPRDEVSSNVLAIIDGVLTSPDYVP